MSEQDKAFIPISQDEAGYTPLAISATQACSNCRFFYQNGEGGYACHLINNWPEPIVPNGVCNRWEAGTMPEPEPMAVTVVGDIEAVEVLEAQAGEALQQPGVIDRIWQVVQEAIFGKEPLNSFKVLDDGKHWVAYYTNNFEDREKEILSEQAHERFIGRLKTGIVPTQELWFWHIPGTKHGKALWTDRINHFVVAVGEFTDDAIGKAFSEHYRKSKTRYANSHGFFADRAKHYQKIGDVGVWTDYNTFEITVLPVKAAANPFTLFTEIDTMAITEESAAALAGIIGKDAADKIIADAQRASKEVKDLGVQYKDFTDPAALETPAPDTAAVEALSKNVAPLLLGMAETQGDFATMQKAFDTRLNGLTEKMRQLQNALAERDTEIAALKAQLSLTPRRASTDSATALADDAAVGNQTIEEMKQRMAGQEFDPFFGDMEVPANRG